MIDYLFIGEVAGQHLHLVVLALCRDDVVQPRPLFGVRVDVVDDLLHGIVCVEEERHGGRRVEQGNPGMKEEAHIKDCLPKSETLRMHNALINLHDDLLKEALDPFLPNVVPDGRRVPHLRPRRRNQRVVREPKRQEDKWNGFHKNIFYRRE